MLVASDCRGEVKQSAADGFQIALSIDTSLTPAATSRALIDDFAAWYDPRHSYSGKAENLSIDLVQHAMIERLPEGGFVRHMEIVYYQPGQRLTLAGGLGPLQAMGVHGALTFALSPSDSGSTVTLTYQVSGSSLSQLDKIAPLVDQVLAGQLARLQQHCQRLADRP
jgi:hypothetical protein